MFSVATRRIPGVLAGLIFFLTFVSVSHSAVLAENDKAPEFILPTPEGRQVSLSDYRGKYLLLNFWATWCAPCKIEMPSLEVLYQRFKSKNFDILAISNDMFGAKVVKPYLQTKKLNFTVLLDPTLDVSNQYGIVGLPTTILVGPGGKVLGILNGAEDWSTDENLHYFESLLRNN